MILSVLVLSLQTGVTMGSLRALVPADMRPVPLPPAARNGWKLAAAASGRAIRPDTMEDLDDALAAALDKDQAGSKPAPRSVTARELLANWSERAPVERIAAAEEVLRRDAKRLADLKAALRHAVWAPSRMADAVRPKPGDIVSTHFPQFAGLKEMSRVLSLRARVSLEEGDTAGAIDDLIRARRVGERLGAGHFELVGALVGQSIEATASREVHLLAQDPRMDEASIARLQTDLSKPNPGRYAANLRTELDLFLISIASLPEWAGENFPPSGIPAKSRAELRNLRVLDRAATVRDAVALYRAAIIDRGRAWGAPRRTDLVLKRLEPKNPDGASVPLDRTPTPEEWPKSIAWLKRNPNVLGSMLVSMNGATLIELEHADRRREAAWVATTTLLALRRYRLRHDKDAPSLQALKADGLLMALPTDPFSRAPLRYDSKRRILWSLGQDGKDQGGRNRLGTTKPDITWPTDGKYPKRSAG